MQFADVVRERRAQRCDAQVVRVELAPAASAELAASRMKAGVTRSDSPNQNGSTFVDAETGVGDFTKLRRTQRAHGVARIRDGWHRRNQFAHRGFRTEKK